MAALPNVDIRLATEVAEVDGERELERVTLQGADGEREVLPLSALFVFIGQSPRTDWMEGFVLRDKAGFVLSGREVLEDAKPPAGWGSDREPFLLEASVPGIFVAGDVRFRSVKRIASAVGEGSMAVQFVHQYLATL
jgi:thioredoxin reductase (NADPH)